MLEVKIYGHRFEMLVLCFIFPAAVQMLLVALVTVLLVAVLVQAGLLIRQRRLADEAPDREKKEDVYFDASPTSMIIFDENLSVVQANAAAVAMMVQWGKNPQRLMFGQIFVCAGTGPFVNKCGEESSCPGCSLRRALQSVFVEGQAIRDLELKIALLLKDGLRDVWLSVCAEPVAVDGVKQVVVSLEDVSGTRRRQERMRQDSQDLEKMNLEIQQASHAKGQFLANMSHEIRTPLNGVIGMSSLLMNTSLNDEQQEYAESIRASAEALLVVVNEVLDYSKIEANKIVLEEASFDLRHSLEESLRVVAPEAAKKKLRMGYRIDPSLELCWVGDVGRLRQILVNLVGNAIKFTERGSVDIAVNGTQLAHEKFRLSFAVRDTGVGILPQYQALLFQPFSQVDTSATRRFGGTGLGLVISKGLCEMMGGAISVESSGIPGQGSVFRFSIVVKRDLRLATQASGKLEGAGGTRHILIVEGYKASRRTLSEQLVVWGMVASTAVTGSAAMDLLRSSHPVDVVLLDSDIGDYTVFNLVEEIRSLPNRPGLPIILLLSEGEPNEWSGGGVQECLTKPVPAMLLHKAITKALAERAALKPASAKTIVTPLSQTFSQKYPLKILLAEDNEVNLLVAVKILNKLGYDADVVKDGVQAVRAVAEGAYDIVLMDIQMPTLDGEQATLRIRREVPLDRQPVIVALTAHALHGDRERYLAAGMDDYISKPIRLERLIDVLRAVKSGSSSTSTATSPGGGFGKLTEDTPVLDETCATEPRK